MLSTEAAEKDVTAFSQEDATAVNKLDSDGRLPYRLRRTRTPPGKGRGKKPLNQNQNDSTSECLSCRKTGHPRSQCKYRNSTCHTCGQSGHITVHASLNLRRSTLLKSQKHHNSTSLQIHFLSQSSASMQRTMASKYPLN